MNKICTDIEQSKKLIELGIGRKSSDMFYWCGEDLRIGGYKAQSEEFDISAWSLSALLKLMPFHIIKHNIRYGISFWKGYNSGGDTYCYEYISNEEFKLFETKHHNDPLDAAFEMIVWLKENKEI